MRDAGAVKDRAVLFGRRSEIGQARDIDEQSRRGDPQIHHRDERLAAGDDPRIDIGARQHLERFR